MIDLFICRSGILKFSNLDLLGVSVCESGGSLKNNKYLYPRSEEKLSVFFAVLGVKKYI